MEIGNYIRGLDGDRLLDLVADRIFIKTHMKVTRFF